jgi:hypothetical protein
MIFRRYALTREKANLRDAYRLMPLAAGMLAVTAHTTVLQDLLLAMQEVAHMGAPHADAKPAALRALAANTQASERSHPPLLAAPGRAAAHARHGNEGCDLPRHRPSPPVLCCVPSLLPLWPACSPAAAPRRCCPTYSRRLATPWSPTASTSP